MSGEIAGLVSIDDDPEVESIACWSEELQPSQKFPDWVWRRSTRTEALHASFWQARWRNLEDAAAKSAHMLVAKDNVKALRSYEKLVFEKVGEYVLQGHDYWCFEKKL